MGVSVAYLILAVVNQGLWLSWAILVPDTGTTIAANVTGTIAVFNLTWWSLRLLGLRSLLATGTAHSEPRNPTTGQLQPSSSRAPDCGHEPPAGRPRP